MKKMGIVINLYLIPRRISPKEWGVVYQESLKLVEACDLMDRIEMRRNGLRYCFARKTGDREGFPGKSGHGWLSVGDLRTGEGTGTFMLMEDIHAYLSEDEAENQAEDKFRRVVQKRPQGSFQDLAQGKYQGEPQGKPQGRPQGQGGEILLNLLEEAGETREKGKAQGCVNIWGQQTRGGGSHIYLLAIACLIASRFPEAAMVSGDISAGQCRRALKWANQYLERPIGLPVTSQRKGLLKRLKNTSLSGVYLLEAFYQLTDEAKDDRMGEFLRKEFTQEELYGFYRQRFLNFQIDQRGFVRVMKEYLEMGFDFKGLCRLAVSDPEGVQAEPEEFLRRVLESKLHVREKETYDFAKMARQRGDNEETDTDKELSARIFSILVGMDNRNVNAFYPLEKIREDCKEVFGDRCQVDELINRLMKNEEEMNSKKDSLQAILYDNPDGLFRQGFGMAPRDKRKRKKRYDINSYRELVDFVPGCHMKPELEQDLIRNFCLLHQYVEIAYEEFSILKKEERENYLIQETTGLLLREEVWEIIFDRIMDDDYIVRIYGVLCVNREIEDGELFCRSLLFNLKAIDYYWEKTKVLA